MATLGIQSMLLEHAVANGYKKVLFEYSDALRQTLDNSQMSTALHLRVVLSSLEKIAAKIADKSNRTDDDLALAAGLVLSLLDLDNQIVTPSFMTKVLVGLQVSVLFTMLQKDDKNVLARLNSYFPVSGFSHPNVVEPKLVEKLTIAHKSFRKFFIPLIADRGKRMAYMSGDFHVEYGEELFKKSTVLLQGCCAKFRAALPPTSLERLLLSVKKERVAQKPRVHGNVLFKSFLQEIENGDSLNQDKVLEMLDKFTKQAGKRKPLSPSSSSSSDSSFDSYSLKVASPPNSSQSQNAHKGGSEDDKDKDAPPRRTRRRTVAPKKYAESSSSDDSEEEKEEEEEEEEEESSEEESEEVIAISSADDTDESQSGTRGATKKVAKDVLKSASAAKKGNHSNQLELSSDLSAFQLDAKSQTSTNVRAKNVYEFYSTPNSSEERTEGKRTKEGKKVGTPRSVTKGKPKVSEGKTTPKNKGTIRESELLAESSKTAKNKATTGKVLAGDSNNQQQIKTKTSKTPRSAKKINKSSEETTAENKAVKDANNDAQEDDHNTPKSSKKNVATKIAAERNKTPGSVKKTTKTPKSAKGSGKTPKSAKQFGKTPKSGKKLGITPKSAGKRISLNLKKTVVEMEDTSSDSQEEIEDSEIPQEIPESISSEDLSEGAGKARRMSQRKSESSKSTDLNTTDSDGVPEKRLVTPKSGQKNVYTPKAGKTVGMTPQSSKKIGLTPKSGKKGLTPSNQKSVGLTPRSTRRSLVPKKVIAEETSSDSDQVFETEGKDKIEMNKVGEGPKVIGNTPRRTSKRRSECRSTDLDGTDSEDANKEKGARSEVNSPLPAKIARLRDDSASGRRESRRLSQNSSDSQNTKDSDLDDVGSSKTPKSRSSSEVLSHGKKASYAEMLRGEATIPYEKKTPKTPKSNTTTTASQPVPITPTVIIQNESPPTSKQPQQGSAKSTRYTRKTSEELLSGSEESDIIPVYTPKTAASIATRVTRNSPAVAAPSPGKAKGPKRSLTSSAENPVLKKRVAYGEVTQSPKASPSRAHDDGDESEDSWQTCSEPDSDVEENVSTKKVEKNKLVGATAETKLIKVTRRKSLRRSNTSSEEDVSPRATSTKVADSEKGTSSRRKSSVSSDPLENPTGGTKSTRSSIVQPSSKSTTKVTKKLLRKASKREIKPLTSSESEIELPKTISVPKKKLTRLRKLSQKSPLPDFKKHLRSPKVERCMVLLTKKKEVKIAGGKKAVVRF